MWPAAPEQGRTARPSKPKERLPQPSTCQFNSARSVKFALPFASSRVRKRIPQIANNSPKTPPNDASRTLSVSSCRTIRPRLAPTLRRSAISRLLDAARASSRLAILAHASPRINPTSVIST